MSFASMFPSEVRGLLLLDWVSLAGSAQLTSIDHNDHDIQLDRADVVLDEIHELLR